ncbi:MAG: prepilin-type N-terminal cleavage/methylation domain-containing protein [Candidatus Pacebacteria bacterium]|nr:prepilin-type N-terminal cleavage/methylation domain-containing protein [Candidatus Paceibacterota bacterium]MCF7862546.1 prepilin-type N-terminal cleavage/methylation domain-containing protein [Candidatus Paceibacterota bacterium]
MKHSKGFTLIELLVVVAIIGILSSVVLASLNSARAKARDARRLSDVTQIQKALELYFNENGKYPPYNRVHTQNIESGCTSGTVGWCNFKNALAPYLKDVADPLGQHNVYVYHYDSNLGDGNSTYGFMLRFESSSNDSKSLNDGGAEPLYYEVGQQPVYCKNKYGGSWWNSGANVCVAGN